jgi:hypothetical protein
MSDSPAADLANELLPLLTEGKDFSFPDIDLDDPSFELPDDTGDLYGPLVKLTNADLTQKIINGNGTFDVIMSALNAHLADQFEKGRITGNDYTTAYVGVVEAAMSGGIQFLLSRDQAFWQSALVQAQAQKAAVDLVTARVGLKTALAGLAVAKSQAWQAEVEYATSKIKLAEESVTYDNALKQGVLISEQGEAARAQTLDTRTDGSTVEGSVGKQKDLYDQQITSYQRDAEVKAAKLYTDAWTVMKTIDEGLVPPTSFTNDNLQIVLGHIQANNDLS